MSYTPRASIVIVNHNGGDLARLAVESALAQEYPNFEVVVVDNGSDDSSLAGILASPFFEDAAGRTRVVRLPRNLGCSGGRNAGVRAATGELVAFLDSDAFAPKGWLAAVVQTFSASNRVGIVASTSVSMRNSHVLQSQGGIVTLSGHAFDLGFGEPWEFTRIGEAPAYAMGNGMVVRREAFAQVGFFDESYRNYYEDVDFCLRAQLAGYELRPCSVAPIAHFGGYSNESFGDKPLLLDRHRISTVLKLWGWALLTRWLLHEAWSFVAGGHGVDRGIRLRAWRWNLARLFSIAGRRLRMRYKVRSPADLRGLREVWGPVASPSQSALYAPESVDLTRGVEIGDKQDKAIAYGFYWPEEGLGERFRWTNGFGSLLVRASQSIHRLAFRLHFGDVANDPGVFCLLLLIDRARDAVYAGRIEQKGTGWCDYHWTVDAPRGNYELLVVSGPTRVEPHGWSRRLGVGVASVHCA